MDARRLLISALAGAGLSACAVLSDAPVDTAALAPSVAAAAADPGSDPDQPGAQPVLEWGSGDDTASALPAAASVGTPYEAVSPPHPGATGRAAITAANAQARAPSRSDAFVGGVQIFAWSPGRVFEVWTAPLRVTTLTLGAGETLVSKAAGDTVRWQIGETTSGDGAARRAHVLLKPLERGLETNLVLTTNRRVYYLELKSGPADGFNAAIAWDAVPAAPAVAAGPADAADPVVDPVVTPHGALDARYRIQARGRRPRWTPTSVFNDANRTFIAFDADLRIDEAPALFVLAPDGEAQMVNYRQAGGLFIVDRVFDRAELRLGDRRPQVVRIERLPGATR